LNPSCFRKCCFQSNVQYGEIHSICSICYRTLACQYPVRLACATLAQPHETAMLGTFYKAGGGRCLLLLIGQGAGQGGPSTSGHSQISDPGHRAQKREVTERLNSYGLIEDPIYSVH
jgi:hypothetical protein